jgi:hypothetical protein
MNTENGRKSAFTGAILAAALFAFAAGAAAQSLPLDDKARYEKALEQKTDEVLLKLLGPNQAKVAVQAAMDFSRTEKVEVTTNANDKKDDLFKWQGGSSEAGQPFNEYLLPGFPSMGAAEPENRTYQKQLIFPASFIKRLTVTVIINKTLSEPEAQNVRTVVSEVLGLDPKRGDELSVIKAPFAPIWRTIWYTPEAVGLVFKYGILSLIGIISMIVVAVGFLKLAAAMNTMAKAQQSHQITMDMGKGLGAAGAGAGGGGIPGLPGSEKLELISGEKRGPDKGGEGGGQEDRFFNVRPEQVDFLVNLMSGEDPANISLVAGHLHDDIKSDFLRKLPPDLSAEVMASMAHMRFVEPEVIATIREELERRLSGAFGGVNKVIEALEKVSLKAKREMLEKLERRHPDVAREVRPHIFLAEDLAKFSEKDMSLVATAVKVEEWAMALWALPAQFKDKLKKQLTEKTWAMLEQTMKYGSPSADKTELAVEGVVTAALKLMNEGRISNPLLEPDKAAALPAPAGAAALPLPPRPPVMGGAS